MKAFEVIKCLRSNRWFCRRVVGSHHHFKHPEIAGVITVPYHGTSDLHPAVLHNILKMAKLSLNDFKPSKVKKSHRNIGLGANNAITNSY